VLVMWRLLACAAVMVLVAGCSSDLGPEAATEPAPPPETRQTTIADAPPGIRAVEYGKPCGQEKVGYTGKPASDTEVVECIRRSLADRAPAWGTLVFLTREGDPVLYTYVVRAEGDVSVFVDSTKDSLGTSGWTAYACQSLPGRFGLPKGCSQPTTVDAATPAEFLERRALDSCGRLKRVTIEDLPFVDTSSPNLECFYRALAKGKPAELLALSKNEEGPIDYYFRATEDGGVERYADGEAFPAWYFSECRSLVADLGLRGCSPSVELTD
jgi:hypothetical protein